MYERTWDIAAHERKVCGMEIENFMNISRIENSKVYIPSRSIGANQSLKQKSCSPSWL